MPECRFNKTTHHTVSGRLRPVEIVGTLLEVLALASRSFSIFVLIFQACAPSSDEHHHPIALFGTDRLPTPANGGSSPDGTVLGEQHKAYKPTISSPAITRQPTLHHRASPSLHSVSSYRFVTNTSSSSSSAGKASGTQHLAYKLSLIHI